MIKFYYTYDQETLIVNQTPISTTRFSGIPEYPRDALLVKPLPEKSGFVVRVCEFVSGRPTATEYVEDNRGKTIYSTTTKESKSVDYLGEIESEWTLLEPSSEFDEWDGTAWVKNLDLAFKSEMDAVNSKYDKDVIDASNAYNVAVARDGSTETEKVTEARALIADLDNKYDADQLAIINKYCGE